MIEAPDGQTIRIACPVCGDGSFSKYLSVDSYFIVKCDHCRFTLVNPRPTEESILALYRSFTNPYMHATYEPDEFELPTLVDLASQMRKRLKPETEIFEIACGRGTFLEVLARQGFRVSGCDFVSSTTPHSSRIFPSRLVDCRFESSTFDAVIARNVLEHLFDPYVELKEAWRILRRGGLLYVKVPNLEYSEGLRLRLMTGFKKRHDFIPPFHLNYFMPVHLRMLIERAGFELLEWRNEVPTRSGSPVQQFVRSGFFHVAETMKSLTSGRLYPQVTLGCFAKSLASTGEVA